MSDAWGGAWGDSWGGAWGAVDTAAPSKTIGGGGGGRSRASASYDDEDDILIARVRHNNQIAIATVLALLASGSI